MLRRRGSQGIKMADQDESRSRKRPKKKGIKESSADIIAGLAKLLDQNAVKKTKKKATIMQFRRDPLTGRRVYKSKYRPNRKSQGAKSTNDTGLDEEMHDSCEPFIEQCADQDSDGNYEFLLNEADDLLHGWTDLRDSQANDWGKRMESVNANWQASRTHLFESMLKCSAPRVQKCNRCNLQEAVIRCIECVQYGTYLCYSCDDEVHSLSPFHDREVFPNGFFQNIKPTISVDAKGCLVTIKRIFPFNPVACPSCYNNMEAVCSGGQCIIITIQGRFDLDVVSYYQCIDCSVKLPFKLDLESVIKMGFWPGTPSNFCHLFDRDLLVYWDMAQKRMPGVSERSFITILEDFSLAKGRIGVINISTFSRSFKEWKFCQYELELLQKKEWMICPACSQKQHSAHVDGNMKLYRFVSAGKRQRECYYGEAFIASNSKVDQHIQQVYKGSKKKELSVSSSKCGESNWRAAGNSVKKKRNLDETGLEILGCRHSIAQAAVNMFYGEVYGYAHYLQKVFLVPKKVNFLWYDVICKFWPWLRKADPTCAETMQPALSVMHAKAHAWTCQVLWGGRWQPGAGGTTGEEVEQINSHFSRLGNSTKHMLPEGREELLTEHALFWNRKKIERMPMILSKRFVKAMQQETETKKRIVKCLEEVGVPDINLEEWIIDVQEAAKEEELSRKKVVEMNFDEEAYLASVSIGADQTVATSRSNYLIQCSRKLYPKFFEKVQSLENGKVLEDLKEKSVDGTSWDAVLLSGEASLVQKVQSDLQMKIESLHYNIAQLAVNIGKLTDSSKQRTRLRAKLTVSKAELKECINGLKVLHPEEEIDVEAIEQGTFPWLERSRQGIPMRVKKMVAELAMERRRFSEETELLKSEISNFLCHYKDVIIPTLQSEEASLKAKLEEGEALNIPDDSGNTPAAPDISVLGVDLTVQNEESKYATKSTNRDVVKGRIALARRGIDFAMEQISSGVSVFKKVLNENIADISELLRNCEDDENVHQVDQNEDSGEEDNGDDDVLNSCPVDSIIPRTLNGEPLPYVNSKIDCHGSNVWLFPLEFSQGCVDGRNGSNACSLIALIIGQAVFSQDVEVPIEGYISPLWSTMLYHSMVTGNNIYDRYRASLPARYLSAAEACDILARNGNFLLEPEEPLPVRLEDEHRMTCISSQLELLTETPSRKLALFTMSEKTSLFVVHPPDVVYVDSHCHAPDAGAAIVLSRCHRLKEFCHSVWDIEGARPDTYGNLVLLLD